MTLRQFRKFLEKTEVRKVRKSDITPEHDELRHRSIRVMRVNGLHFIPNYVVGRLQFFPADASVTVEAPPATSSDPTVGFTKAYTGSKELEDLVGRWRLPRSRGVYRFRMIPESALKEVNNGKMFSMRARAEKRSAPPRNLGLRGV